MAEFRIDPNLHTLHNRIPKVHMDTRNNGGIHLWITSNYIEEFGDGSKSVSVHLSAKESILLAKEIIYRVYGSALAKLNDMVNIQLFEE